MVNLQRLLAERLGINCITITVPKKNHISIPLERWEFSHQYSSWKVQANLRLIFERQLLNLVFEKEQDVLLTMP